jgi:hypothetical protein
VPSICFKFCKFPAALEPESGNGCDELPHDTLSKPGSGALSVIVSATSRSFGDQLGMSRIGRLLAGGGFVAGVFGLLSILTRFDSLKDFKDALGVYIKYVREPLAKGLGLDILPLAGYGLDVIVVWAALFMAINAFVQQHDGLFVWGYIRRSYCFRERQTFAAQTLCVLPKFGLAFLATPLVCIIAIWSSIVRGQPSITMAYMTVEPKVVARYLSALFGTPALIAVMFLL